MSINSDLSAFSTATLLDRKRRLEALLRNEETYTSERWMEWKMILEELMDREYYGRVIIRPVDGAEFAQLSGAISDEE